MNYKKITCMVIGTVLMMALFVACNNKEPSEEVNLYVGDITFQQEEEIKQVIENYFEVLFSTPLEEYSSNHAVGLIPEELREFIANKTLVEGNNNPGVGIHLPRYVNINDRIIVGYGLGNEGQILQDVEIAYIEEKNEEYLFYVRLDLIAEVVDKSVFESDFRFDSNKNYYLRADNGNSNTNDLIRIRAKYDVKVVQESSGFKILTAKESLTDLPVNQRLNLLNNRFIERLPYLDKTNEADRNIISHETNVIKTFFEEMPQIDMERMKLLRNNWEQGKSEFEVFLNTIRFKTEYMNLQDNYKTNFNIEDFPLGSNMNRITRITDLSADIHPSYSRNNKIYEVIFHANVEPIGGTGVENSTYRYRYLVQLSGLNDNIVVNSIKLRERYKIN